MALVTLCIQKRKRVFVVFAEKGQTDKRLLVLNFFELFLLDNCPNFWLTQLTVYERSKIRNVPLRT
jgi:hypothetical protein